MNHWHNRDNVLVTLEQSLYCSWGNMARRHMHEKYYDMTTYDAMLPSGGAEAEDVMMNNA
jgi:hypothetical protein